MQRISGTTPSILSLYTSTQEAAVCVKGWELGIGYQGTLTNMDMTQVFTRHSRQLAFSKSPPISTPWGCGG